MTNAIEELKTPLTPREYDTHVEDTYPYQVRGVSGTVIITPPPTEKARIRSITFQSDDNVGVKVVGFHPEEIKMFAQYLGDPSKTVTDIVGTTFEKSYHDDVVTITVTKPYSRGPKGSVTFSQKQATEAIELLNRFPQTNGLFS